MDVTPLDQDTINAEDKTIILRAIISDLNLALRTPLQFGAFSRATTMVELREALHEIVTRAMEGASESYDQH